MGHVSGLIQCSQLWCHTLFILSIIVINSLKVRMFSAHGFQAMCAPSFVGLSTQTYLMPTKHSQGVLFLLLIVSSVYSSLNFCLICLVFTTFSPSQFLFALLSLFCLRVWFKPLYFFGQVLILPRPYLEEQRENSADNFDLHHIIYLCILQFIFCIMIFCLRV